MDTFPLSLSRLYLIGKLCAEKSPSEWMRPVSTLHWDFAGLPELWAAGWLLCCCGDEWIIIKFNIRFLFIFLPFSFLGHHTTHHRSAKPQGIDFIVVQQSNNIRTRGRHPLTSSCYYDTNRMDLFGRFRIIRPCVPSSNHAHSSVPFGSRGNGIEYRLTWGGRRTRSRRAEEECLKIGIVSITGECPGEE